MLVQDHAMAHCSPKWSKLTKNNSTITQKSALSRLVRGPTVATIGNKPLCISVNDLTHIFRTQKYVHMTPYCLFLPKTSPYRLKFACSDELKLFIVNTSISGRQAQGRTSESFAQGTMFDSLLRLRDSRPFPFQTSLNEGPIWGASVSKIPEALHYHQKA